MFVSKQLSQKIVADLKGSIPLQRGTFRDSLKENGSLYQIYPTGNVYMPTIFTEFFGYQLEEVLNKHHSVLCFPEDVEKREYKELWQSLAKGEPTNGTFIRKDKAGNAVWLEATYFPIIKMAKWNLSLKVASHVTTEQAELERNQALLKALDKSLAVIDFSTDGIVLGANKTFLIALDIH